MYVAVRDYEELGMCGTHDASLERFSRSRDAIRLFSHVSDGFNAMVAISLWLVTYSPKAGSCNLGGLSPRLERGKSPGFRSAHNKLQGLGVRVHGRIMEASKHLPERNGY